MRCIAVYLSVAVCRIAVYLCVEVYCIAVILVQTCKAKITLGVETPRNLRHSFVKATPVCFALFFGNSIKSTVDSVLGILNWALRS